MLSGWIRALTQDRLDARLRVGGLDARIVEKPGLWMSEADCAALVADLRAVARRTLPAGDLDYGVLTGARERLAVSTLTILYDRAGAPVAFNALPALDVTLHGRRLEVLHLGLVMIDPGARSRGLSQMLYGLATLFLFARNQLRPMWFSNVTQVPAIVGMVCEFFSRPWPSPHAGSHRSFEHETLAREILARHRGAFGVGADAGFDGERFVLTNAYTGGSDHLKKTFDEAPKHREAIYNAFCRRELDYARGDDVLQLCVLDLAAARRFLMKSLPPASLPAVAAALCFAWLGKVALPLAHWLSAERPWGVLRPRGEGVGPP